MTVLKNRKFFLIISVGILIAGIFCMIAMNAKYISNRELHSSVQVSLLLQGDEADLYESPIELQSDGSYVTKDIDTKENDDSNADGIKPSRMNEYKYVLPGLNIPKDPKIFITKKSGTHAYLYVEVIEKNFPGKYTENGFIAIGEDDEINKTHGTDAIYYQLEEFWRPLFEADGETPLKGENGGDLYVYYNQNDSALADYMSNENKATYISSYIMKDDKNGSIPMVNYYGINEINTKNGVENQVPYFNIIKDKTIYVSEKFIHNEYYSDLAKEGTLEVGDTKYNFGLYFYGYMASAKENGIYISPESAYEKAQFLNESEYEAKLNK